MKILLFHTYNQGYLSDFFHELAVKLVCEGYEVISFSWKTRGSEQFIDGVKVIVTKKKGYFSNYKKVYGIIKKEKPDIILSNFSYVNPALLFGRLFGVKKNLVWFHSLQEQMEASKLQVYVKKQFLKLADIVVANSYLTQKELQHIYAVSESKTKAIPFWSNINEKEIGPTEVSFSAKTQVVKIGCPGRMVTHKNQEILLDALSKLYDAENHSFHLYFAGVGETLTGLKEKAKNLHLLDKVTFLQHLSANDMLHFYKEMDVVVLPSLHEAFGLVFIEAISLGTPVIVSDQFGALSFLDKTETTFSDFTFNPASSDDLLDKLIPYLKREGLPKAFFKQLYEQYFDKDVIFKNFLNIIKTA